MADIGIKDNDGLYGGEELKKHGRSKNKNLNDKDRRKLLNGSPHKFYKRKAIKIFIGVALLGIAVGIMIFLLGCYVGLLWHGDVIYGNVNAVRLTVIILACLGSGISVIIWFIRMTRKRRYIAARIMGEDGRFYVDKRGVIKTAYLSYGQSKYNRTEVKKECRNMLKICLLAVLSLIALFIVVLIVGRVIVPISSEWRFLYLLLWFAPIAVITFYANAVLWIIYYARFSISRITDLSCPKCNYLNTVIYVGFLSESTSKYDRKISSTKSHEYQTHTVYDSAGNKVGGVYGWTSGEDTYSYGTETTTYYKWICAKCGCEFYSSNSVSHEEGRRYEPNGR